MHLLTLDRLLPYHGTVYRCERCGYACAVWWRPFLWVVLERGAFWETHSAGLIYAS